jgi:hypothetical protein
MNLDAFATRCRLVRHNFEPIIPQPGINLIWGRMRDGQIGGSAFVGSKVRDGDARLADVDPVCLDLQSARHT